MNPALSRITNDLPEGSHVIMSTQFLSERIAWSLSTKLGFRLLLVGATAAGVLWLAVEAASSDSSPFRLGDSARDNAASTEGTSNPSERSLDGFGFGFVGDGSDNTSCFCSCAVFSDWISPAEASAAMANASILDVFITD